MTAQAQPALAATTANDKLKASFQSWFWGSIMAATVIHFCLFNFWPEMTAADIATNMKNWRRSSSHRRSRFRRRRSESLVPRRR